MVMFEACSNLLMYQAGSSAKGHTELCSAVQCNLNKTVQNKHLHTIYFCQKMVDSLVGSYKFEKNENFESFLSATGVPFIPRKMMVSVSPSVNISKDGEVWTVTFNVLFKSFSVHFELGKTFVEENPVSKEINKVNARFKNN